MINKLFKLNKKSARIMIQCASEVDKSAITRESRDGVEHIIITSKTLPDDIVMNGGFYSASEIASSFGSLERTLAPVEHPHDSDGNFLSVLDPISLNNFHVGAHNERVRHEDGRVVMDKVINVQAALKSDKGKRLLDRINEIETSEDPRAIHTSVGVFLEVEELPEMMTNADGLEYSWIAKNMVFDHDAILLDSVGAAQPHQGVGLAINEDGEKIKVQKVQVEPKENEQSHSTIRDRLHSLARDTIGSNEYIWIADVFEDTFVYELDDKYFKSSYSNENDEIKIVGIAEEVFRSVAYQPVTNKEGDIMLKELILNALKAKGVDSEGMSEDDMLKAYLKINSESDDSGKPDETPTPVVNGELTDQLAKLTGVVDSLIAKQNNEDQAEIDGLVELVVSAGKVGLEAEDLKKLSVAALRKLAANSETSYGIPAGQPAGNASDSPYEMPA